ASVWSSVSCIWSKTCVHSPDGRAWESWVGILAFLSPFSWARRDISERANSLHSQFDCKRRGNASILRRRFRIGGRHATCRHVHASWDRAGKLRELRSTREKHEMVRGQVRYRGTVVGGGTIVFAPDPELGGDGPLAKGVIAPDGSYMLHTDI